MLVHMCVAPRSVPASLPPCFHPTASPPPSAGGRRGQTWGLDCCPLSARLPGCAGGGVGCESLASPIVLQDAWSSPQQPARLLWQSGPRMEGLSSGPGRPEQQSQGPKASRNPIPSGREITFQGTPSPAPLLLAARPRVLVSRSARAHGALTPAFEDPQGGGSLHRNHSEKGCPWAPSGVGRG